MKFRYSILHGLVITLLVFVILTGLTGVGVSYARMELMRELNNTDGDPGAGSDSFGSGSSNCEYFAFEDIHKQPQLACPIACLPFEIGNSFVFQNLQLNHILHTEAFNQERKKK